MAEEKIPDVTVQPGGVVEEKIRSICTGYCNLMAECCADQKVFDHFKENMHEALNAPEVGMTIPDNVNIVLNTKEGRWSKVYVRTKNGNVSILEKPLGLDVIETFPNKEEKSITVVPFDDIHVSIQNALTLDGCIAVAELPFFDVNEDSLIDFKLNDDTTEIILSGC